MRRILLCLAALIAAAVAACGGAPDELPRDTGRQLELSRDRIAAAIDTRERLASSPVAAQRLLARVRKIVATGALEPDQLDEFGLAALGELGLAAPALVVYDERQIPRQLDRDSLRVFLQKATTDPDAAIRRPAAIEVARISDLLGAADAGPDTTIPTRGQATTDYLTALESRLYPTWPDLAADLAATRADLR
ncbi:MAG: hypothetical protein WEB79_12405 [Thermoleophilaceae bacterium]